MQETGAGGSGSAEGGRDLRVHHQGFQKQATLPGFRPGKAPREWWYANTTRTSRTKSKRKLISDPSKASEEQKLDVLGHPDIEEIQFGRGQPLQFAATIETAPEFELPEYKGLPVKRKPAVVTDEDVERAWKLCASSR